MEFLYWYDVEEDRRRIYVRTFGDIYYEDFVKLNNEFRNKATSLNYNLIIDFRTSINQISFNQALYFNQFAEIHQFDNTKLVPVVHLVKSECNQIFEFIEEIANNKGFIVKTCNDEFEANSWLENIIK